MRVSECICNRIMMKKKYRFFDPFTGEALLNTLVHENFNMSIGLIFDTLMD